MCSRPTTTSRHACTCRARQTESPRVPQGFTTRSDVQENCVSCAHPCRAHALLPANRCKALQTTCTAPSPASEMSSCLRLTSRVTSVRSSSSSVAPRTLSDRQRAPMALEAALSKCLLTALRVCSLPRDSSPTSFSMTSVGRSNAMATPHFISSGGKLRSSAPLFFSPLQAPPPHPLCP